MIFSRGEPLINKKKASNYYSTQFHIIPNTDCIPSSTTANRYTVNGT